MALYPIGVPFVGDVFPGCSQTSIEKYLSEREDVKQGRMQFANSPMARIGTPNWSQGLMDMQFN